VSSGQAEVYKGIYSSALKLPVAVKVLYVDKGSEKAFVAEVMTLRNLRHRNILAMETFFEEPQFCIVTKWMDKGSLNELLERERKTGVLLAWEPRGRKYALDIASGLAYLHGQKVVHRDLKSLNVFVGGDDVAVLADFGYSKFVESTSVQVATAGQVGTVHWMAPEMIEHGTYTAASDVYALGIIVWELCACRLPYETFESRHQLENAVLRGERPVVDAKWPKEARDLMTSCWSGDAGKRPGALRLMQILAAQSGTAVLSLAMKLRAQGDYVKAHLRLAEAADSGNVAALFELGEAYLEESWGVSEDAVRAADLIRAAAESGYGPAMARLGYMYRQGLGVPVDQKNASRWGSKALSTKDPFACGLCWYWGLGVKRDGVQAVRLLTQAADAGNLRAQNILGECFYDSEDVPLDWSAAVDRFSQAAEKGDARALFNLAVC
jgi:hypothetical protein